MPAPLLAVENLSVTLGGSPILDRISFSLAPGEALAVVGESGCGKSVTGLAIMGLLPKGRLNSVSGSVRFAGKNLLELGNSEMASLRGSRMAMIFQEPMTALNPVLRAGDQIAEAVIRHRGATPAAARARALELLQRVRVPDAEARLRAYPHELSGGLRQRVMIAMALANEPQLIIADEPTTALDVTIQAQILALIDELRREAGTAVLLITHDLGVVAEIADRVAVMYAGRIAETGPARSLFDDPQHPYTLGLMSSIPALGARGGRLAAIGGSVPPPKLYAPGCRFQPRCPFADAVCAAAAPPLVELSPGHSAACRRAPVENIGAAA